MIVLNLLNWLLIAIMTVAIPAGMIVSSIGLWQTGNTWARIIGVGYAIFVTLGLVGIVTNL